jgi:hypothetical protein
MVDFFDKTEVAPTTITLTDILPSGLRLVDNDITLWDWKGVEIAGEGLTISATPTTADYQGENSVGKATRQNVQIEISGLPEDSDQSLVWESYSARKKLVNSYLDQMLNVGRMENNEFTFRLKVTIDPDYASTFNSYVNTAKITFGYAAVGEDPIAHVTNPVEVATRGQADLSFTKTESTSGEIIDSDVQFTLRNLGVGATPQTASGTYDTIPVYQVGGYFMYSLPGYEAFNASGFTVSETTPMWLQLVETSARNGYVGGTTITFGIYRTSQTDLGGIKTYGYGILSYENGTNHFVRFIPDKAPSNPGDIDLKNPFYPLIE